VVKIDNKYSYVSSVGCGRVDDTGNVSLDVIYPKNGVSGSEICNIDSALIMNIVANPSTDPSITKKSQGIKVTISSNTGINNNMKVYYGFSYTKDNNVIDNKWLELPVTIPGIAAQKKKILEGDVIEIETEFLRTPIGVTGDLFLVLQVEKLENLYTDSWSSTASDNNLLFFGPYKVDNTKPKFNDSTVISSENEYNSINPKLNLKVTDEQYSSTDDLRMCISYDEDNCSTKKKDFTDNSKYEKYDANKVLPKIQDNYDSSTHTIYVTVADAAGNYEKAQFPYRIARKWTLTYNSNGGNACDPSSKSFTFNDWEKNLTWGDLCTPTRSSYIFLGWNTNANGSGTDVTKDTAVTSDLTVYGKWKQPYKYIGHVTSTKKDPCRRPIITIEDKVQNVSKGHMGSCGLVVSANRFTHPPVEYSGFGILTPWQDKWGIYATEANIYYTLNEPTSDVSKMIPLSVYEWYILDSINMYIYKIEPVQTPPGMEYVGEVHTITTYINHGNWAQWSSGLMMIDNIKNEKKTDWACYGTSQPITKGLNYTGFGVIVTGGKRSYDAKCDLGNYKLYATTSNMYYSSRATSNESDLHSLTSDGVMWGHKDNRKYFIYRRKN
jgi:uncharacterized repeat protein (TIGR02543 family)